MGIMTFLVMTVGFVLMDYILKEFIDPGTFKLAGNTGLFISYRFIMFWTFLIALNFGINCIRNDISYGTLSLILTFPISRLEYFLGRISGAFLMSVIYYSKPSLIVSCF
jgi:ABC-type transport system involved in multi-copper enzyme maturation permease subunit